jgi:hypothetical protein
MASSSDAENAMKAVHAHLIIYGLEQLAERDGFDAAREFVKKWLRQLEDQSGKKDVELERGAFEFLDRLEEERSQKQ